MSRGPALHPVRVEAQLPSPISWEPGGQPGGNEAVSSPQAGMAVTATRSAARLHHVSVMGGIEAISASSDLSASGVGGAMGAAGTRVRFEGVVIGGERVRW